TPQQVARIKESLVKRQATLEELGRLAESLTRHPDDIEAKRRVFAILDQLAAWAGTEWDAFFTQEQRRALELQPQPNQAQRQEGANEGPEAQAMAQLMAELEKQRASAELEEKTSRRSARVRFALPGTNASTTKVSIRTAGGLLWMYGDDRTDRSGGSYLFHLDEAKTWAWEKARLLREARDQEVQMKAQPGFAAHLKENPDALRELEQWRGMVE